MANKMIQIPEILFNQMAAYVLIEQARTKELYQQIENGVYEKLDKKTNHELYTKYKTSATDEQREQARQLYLDHVGIQQDFRW